VIEVKKCWATTPCICNICGHKLQLVFEVDIIVQDKKESWKLPGDVVCNKCVSNDWSWPDFETKSPDQE
jgi:hypothetical protein